MTERIVGFFTDDGCQHVDTESLEDFALPELLALLRDVPLAILAKTLPEMMP